MLSVIIITLNEEKNIGRCLESVKWADEIIVVDSGSTDKTQQIVESYENTIFYHQDWLGFGAQKNKALEYAKGEWILWVDADEEVSEALKLSILNILKVPQASAYKLLRRSFFLGRMLKHGDWGRDWIVRLFEKRKVQWTEDVVHESLTISKKSAEPISGCLLHYTQDTIFQSIEKINRYSSLSAEILIQKRKKVTVAKAILRGKMAFVRSYILRLGFLDGVEGYLCAKNIELGAYLKYLKCVYN